MKNYRKLLHLLLILAVCVLTAVGCGSEPELSVSDEQLPQQIYVLGQDLDLSTGKITVKNGDEVTDLAMNAEGVSVSGYDKNTLGEQTVTLTYDGATVSFKVTVVPRMQAVDVTCDYLIGDSFNTAKGKLKITRNDGSSYNVVLNDSKITVTGFDSETAGNCPVTFTYKSGNDTYTAELITTVHPIDEVVFVKPNKVTYKSHDTGLDLSGGLLTLKGKGGELKKDVALTIDMTEGFNLGAVNETNSPLDQEVEVHYLGQTYTFDIKITYTDVTRFTVGSAQMADLDFSHDFLENEEYEPEISKTLGELALHLMTLYADMSPAERALIPLENTLSVARCAMLYGLNIWGDDVDNFAGAFEYEEGQLSLICESAEAIEAAVEKLKVSDRPLFTAPPVMASIVELLADEIFFYEYYFGDFAVADAEALAELSTLFEYMLELDEKADLIPEDWRTLGSLEYADEIEAVYSFIMDGDYAGYTFAQIYYAVSSWRAEDDLFDCMYDYYYKTESTQSLVYLALIRLPSELEVIYAYVLAAMENIDYISGGAMYDTSEFFYNYTMAVKLANEIKAGDDEMMLTLYLGLPLNGLLGVSSETFFYFEYMLDYLRTVEGGYYASSGALLDRPGYTALMEKYIGIVMDIFDDDTYEESDKYKTDLEQMLSLYVALSPAEQYNFLGILNAYYAMNMPAYAFDPIVEVQGVQTDMSCIFVNLLQEYYEGLFTAEEAKTAYVALMVATEAYAQRYTAESGISAFIDKMAALDAILAAMSTDDRAVFDTKLGYIYTKYSAILAEVNPPETDEPTEPDLGDWADEFAELKEAVLGVDLSYQLISGGYNYYSLFMSAFERAQTISNRILTEAPADIVYIYLHSDLYSPDELTSVLDPDNATDSSEWFYWSYDYVVSVYRAVYVNILLTVANGESIYDFYVDEEIAAFISASYDVIWALMWSDSESDEKMFDIAKVHAALAEYRKLSPAAQLFFSTMLEGESSIYYQALDEFIAENYSGACADVATKLIAIEMTYLIYVNTESAEDLEALKTELDALEAAYEALEGDDKAAFADFEAGYLEDVTMIEDAIAEAETEAGDTEENA